jgi:hypothetical protein
MSFFLTGPTALISAAGLSRKTSMAQSGHTIAQLAQPVQFGPVEAAGKYPLLLDFSEMVITLLGQAVTQSVQPLQRSISILIFPAICVYFTAEHAETAEKKQKK